MIGLKGEDALAGRRFPPERRWPGKLQSGMIVIDAHDKIFDTDVGEIIRQAPGSAVDVALHAAHDRQTLFANLTNRLQRSREYRLIRQFRPVQKHAGDLDAAFLHPFAQALDLFLRPGFHILSHRPGRFTGPAKFGIVRIAVGLVAIIQRPIDVAKILGQHFVLRPGVADISMGVLYHIDHPGTGLFKRNVFKHLAVPG